MNSYKKFYLNVILLTIMFGIVYGFCVYRYSTTVELLWINSCLDKKEHFAKMEEKNKIIFTSGSNVLFGVNTKLISKELQIPTYNMAIHAGLGASFVIDEAKNVLKSGDVVILPLEYNLYLGDDEINKLAFDFYRKYQRDKLKKASTYPLQVYYLLTNNPIKVIRHTRFANKFKNVPETASYASVNLNEHGDQTNAVGRRLKEPEQPFKPPAVFAETKSLIAIKEFNQWCTENNIAMYITYPNMLRLPVYNEKAYRDYFENLDHYFSVNNIKTFSSPDDSMLDIDLFYDTNYHLNSEGQLIRTEKLIGNMKKLPEVIKLRESR